MWWTHADFVIFWTDIKLMNGLDKIYLAKFTLYGKVIGFAFDFVE